MPRRKKPENNEEITEKKPKRKRVSGKNATGTASKSEGIPKGKVNLNVRVKKDSPMAMDSVYPKVNENEIEQVRWAEEHESLLKREKAIHKKIEEVSHRYDAPQIARKTLIDRTRDLDERSREKIMWAGVTVVMAAIFIIWIVNLGFILKPSEAQPIAGEEQLEWQEVIDQMNTSFDAAKQELENLKAMQAASSTSAGAVDSATSSPAAAATAGTADAEQAIEELRAKLEAATATGSEAVKE